MVKIAPAKNGKKQNSERNLCAIARQNGKTVGKNNIPTVGKIHGLFKQGLVAHHVAHRFFLCCNLLTMASICASKAAA